jgi:hypothetical protein
LQLYPEAAIKSGMFEHVLTQRYGKRLRLTALLLIWASSTWIIGCFATELSSPMHFAAVIPVCAIYILEKARLISWFSGVTLPTLAVVMSSHLFLWTGHKVPNSPTWAIVGTGIALALSLCFLIVRLWTWDKRNQKVV